MLPPSFTATDTVKLPFQSAPVGLPASSGKVTVRACRRALSWASVAPVMVTVAVPVPPTVPPLPPTAEMTPLLTVTVAERLLAPLSSGSATVNAPTRAVRFKVAEPSSTVTLLALTCAGSLVPETKTLRKPEPTFCVKPAGNRGIGIDGGGWHVIGRGAGIGAVRILAAVGRQPRHPARRW
jgi:hypothetical protein